MNGPLESNTLLLINVCGAVCVGVAVCGSNTLPLLIVFGSEMCLGPVNCF